MSFFYVLQSSRYFLIKELLLNKHFNKKSIYLKTKQLPSDFLIKFLEEALMVSANRMC